MNIQFGHRTQPAFANSLAPSRTIHFGINDHDPDVMPDGWTPERQKATDRRNLILTGLSVLGVLALISAATLVFKGSDASMSPEEQAEATIMQTGKPNNFKI